MKKLLKIVSLLVAFIFVFQMSFIENVNAQLIPVARDRDNGVNYLNTEKCAWFKDEYGNYRGLAIVRRMKEGESFYTESAFEFKRELGYSRSNSFADFRIPIVRFYDFNGNLKNSDVNENLPFEPAVYNSLADSVLRALLKKASS